MSSRRPGAGYKPAVRVVSVLCALGFMLVYSLSKTPAKLEPVLGGHTDQQLLAHAGARRGPARAASRHLLSSDSEDYLGVADDDDGDDGNKTKCSTPRSNHPGYNDSCAYVLHECKDEVVLFNYMRFILCDLPAGLRVRSSAQHQFLKKQLMARPYKILYSYLALAPPLTAIS